MRKVRKRLENLNVVLFAQENGKEFGLHKWAKVRSDGMQSSPRMRMQQVKVFSQQVNHRHGFLY